MGKKPKDDGSAALLAKQQADAEAAAKAKATEAADELSAFRRKQRGRASLISGAGGSTSLGASQPLGA